MNLRTSGLYEILILYLRRLWPDKLLITDGGAQQGLVFYSNAARSYATVSVRKLKYGSSLQHGGKPYSYGFIEGRVAARIDYLLRISIDQPDGLPSLIASVALVRRFKSAENHVRNAPTEPAWYTWYVYSFRHEYFNSAFLLKGVWILELHIGIMKSLVNSKLFQWMDCLGAFASAK